MPKMKTRRAAAKRFQVTGTGEFKRSKAYKRHILEKKSQKRKRNMNFAKFLINRQGQVVKRYFATTKPKRIARDIERLLGEK